MITIITTALISTHFYAFFIPLILLFGFSFDVIFLKKKINKKLWISVLIGCSTIIIYIPTVQSISNSSLSENNWATPSLSNLLNSLKSIYLPFICLLIPAILKWNLHYFTIKEFAKDNYSIFSSLFFLSSFSILGFIISLFFGAYNTRYFLVSILGCLVISTIIISQYNKKQFALFGVLFLALFSFQINNQIKNHIKNNEKFKEVISLYKIKGVNKALIVSSSFNFMKIQHFAKENHKKNIKYFIESHKSDNCKGCGAGDISIFNLSKLNKELYVTDINEIKKMNDTIYYIYSGSPDSNDIKKLFRIRKFDTIGKTKNYYLLESKP